MVQFSEKRKDVRTLHKVPAMVEDLEDGFIYRARMVNYSNGGIYLETDVVLDLGAEIYVGIEDSPFNLTSKTESTKFIQYFRSQIRWQKDLKSMFFNFGYGVKILSIEDGKNIGPKNIHLSQELRKHARKPYYKQIYFTSDNQYYEGLINNVSRIGVFISTRHVLSIGQIVRLVIPQTKFDKGIMIKGKVVRLDNKGVGVQFLSILRKK